MSSVLFTGAKSSQWKFGLPVHRAMFWISATWILYVVQVNPVLTQKAIEYKVVEELPPGTLIGNVLADASLSTKYKPAVISTLSFSFLKDEGLHAQYFIINEASGLLRFSTLLDRDEICPHKEKCIIPVDVTVKPLKYFQIVKVNVEIQDLNDNWPTFPENKLVLSISEAKGPGTSFRVPAARDPDSGQRGIKGYKLISSSSEFELQVAITASMSDVRLVLKDKLDREVVELYQMRIIAFDGGNPSRSGTILIEIGVTDINDNDPKFENSTYELSVVEDTAKQSTVLIVKAHDPDSGDNGKVVYSFDNHTEPAKDNPFGINSNTGAIFVKERLSYNKRHIHHLTLIARDKSPDAVPSSAKLVIHILDINDHPPEIKVNGLSKNGDIQISESAEINTFVAHISVEDKDAGSNGDFTCSLMGTHFSLRPLYMTQFKVITASTLDREIQSEFHLTFRCIDEGNPPMSSSQKIKVTILDENDNKPVFVHNVFVATIEENNAIGTSVTAVNATDADWGKNAVIQYALAENPGNLFSIDPDTGTLTANVQFDRESQDAVTVLVTANDCGLPSRTSTATVSLSIRDQNDEAPQFSRKAYSFGVYENKPIGTQVGKVFASDKDSPPHNRYTLSLSTPAGTIQEVFAIHPQSGTIRTTRKLDRETQNLYNMVVFAKDHDSPWLIGSANLSVYVADENDNSPIIEFPNSKNNTVYMSNLAPVGYIVTQIDASDDDTGSNARLTYTLKKDSQGKFVVDQNTGIITVNTDLRDYDQEFFQLQVAVKDQGSPAQESEYGLNVVVNKSITILQTQSSNLVSGNNLIIILTLSGTLGFMLVILVVVLIVIAGRQYSSRKPRHYLSGNLVRLSHHKDDTLRKHVDLGHDIARPQVRTLNSTLQTQCTDDNLNLASKVSSPAASPGPPTPAHTEALDVTRCPIGMYINPTMIAGRSVQDLGRRQRDMTSQWTVSRLRNTLERPAGKIITNPACGFQGATSRDILVNKLAYGLHASGCRDEGPQNIRTEARRSNYKDSDSACSADVSNTDSGNGASEEGDGNTSKESHSMTSSMRRGSTGKMNSRHRKSPRHRRPPESPSRSLRSRKSYSTNQHVSPPPLRPPRHCDVRQDAAHAQDVSDVLSQYRVARVFPQRNGANSGDEKDQVSPSDSCHGFCGSCHGDPHYHAGESQRQKDFESDGETGARACAPKVPELTPVTVQTGLAKNSVSAGEIRHEIQLDNDTVSSGSGENDTDFYDQSGEYDGRDIIV